MSERRAMSAAVALLVAAAATLVGIARLDSADRADAVSIRAQAIVYRTDQAVGGRFRVKITNLGDEAVEVLGVRLESAGFEPMPFTTEPVHYAPGERTDMVAPHGAARCGAAEPAEPAFAQMRVRPDGGDEQELRVPLQSITEALPKLHVRECQIAGVAAAVDVGFASPIEQVDRSGEAVLAADVVLRRLAGEESILVTDIRGSVLYRIELADDGALPLTMAPAQAEATVPVIISPARCDGHALGESKQPFVFPLGIQIGDEDRVGYDIPVPREQQDQLFEYLVSTCNARR